MPVLREETEMKKKKFRFLKETYLLLITQHHGVSIEVLDERERVLIQILRIIELKVKEIDVIKK